MNLLPVAPAKDEEEHEFLVERRDVSPSNILLKIQSFSLLSRNGNSSKLESNKFEVAGYEWKLIVEMGESDDVGVYLCVCVADDQTRSMRRNWEISALFTFFLYDHTHDNYLCFRGKARRFNALCPKSGYSKLISKGSLTDASKGLVVEDSCVFGAEVIVMNPQPTKRSIRNINKSILECFKPQPRLIKVVECIHLYQVAVPPFTRCWELKRFSQLGAFWKSDKFRLGGFTWCLVVYPRGVERNGSYISIFTYCRGLKPNQRLKAKFCTTIKTQLHSAPYRSSTATDWFLNIKGRGYHEFMPSASLQSEDFVVKDCCFLETEISIEALSSTW